MKDGVFVKTGKGEKAIVVCRQCKDSTFKKSGTGHFSLQRL
jgi:hypothetical protein